MLYRRDFVILSVLFTLATVAAFFDKRPQVTQLSRHNVAIQDMVTAHINAVRRQGGQILTHPNTQGDNQSDSYAALAKIADAQRFDFIGTPQRIGQQNAYQQLVEITRTNGRNLQLIYKITRDSDGVWHIRNITIRSKPSLNI